MILARRGNGSVEEMYRQLAILFAKVHPDYVAPGLSVATNMSPAWLEHASDLLGLAAFGAVVGVAVDLVSGEESGLSTSAMEGAATGAGVGIVGGGLVTALNRSREDWIASTLIVVIALQRESPTFAQEIPYLRLLWKGAAPLVASTEARSMYDAIINDGLNESSGGVFNPLPASSGGYLLLVLSKASPTLFRGNTVRFVPIQGDRPAWGYGGLLYDVQRMYGQV